MVKQGSIIFLDFNPQLGHEQAGKRPALVVSNDLFNRINNMTMVCPITNSEPKTPFQIPLGKNLKTTGCVLCDQVKMVDLGYRKYEYIEMVEQDVLFEVTDILKGIIESV